MVKKLVLLIFIVPSIIMSQNSIKGSFTPAEDYNWIILYKVNPTTTDYIDNAKVSEEGSIEIILDSTFSEGIYKLVYAIPQTEYNFDVIYNGKEDIEFQFNEDEGIEFITSEENKLLTSYSKSIMLINNTLSNFYTKDTQDEKAYMEIIKTLKDAQTNYEQASKGKMVENFIKANAPYIPSGFEDAETYFKNVKMHYLEHVDFNNKVLQASDFLIQRVLNYVYGMTTNPDDVESFKKNIDAVANAMKDTNNEYQAFLLETLWNQLAQTGNDNLANYISKEYLLPLAEDMQNTDLMDKLTIFMSTAIDNIAPNFNFDIKEENGNARNISLLELTGYEKYLLVFWSSTCSHCLEELPKLHAYIDTLPKKGLKVIAIALEEQKDNWEQEILKYPGFTHVFGDNKWDNPIGNAYGVMATPSYFLLDSDKYIISKPYDFEALKQFMESNPFNKN